MADPIQIYYGARQTVLEMMRDRYYTVPESLFQLTEKEFEILFEKRQMDLTGIIDTEGKPVYVKMIEPTRLFSKKSDFSNVFKEVARYFNANGMSDIDNESDLELALNGGLVRLIIVYNSRQARQLRTNHETYITHSHIEVYQVHNINISPKESKYQPQFRLITDPSEISAIYRRYNCKPIMIPSICIDDPINRYYGGRPAEKGKLAHLYEIDRGGTNISYRKVVAKRMNN